MEHRWQGCQLQHQTIHPRNSDGAPPPPSVGGSQEVGPTELQGNSANFVTMLDLPHSQSFQLNGEMFDHKTCYGEAMEAEADVKPPKEKLPNISIFCLKDETRLREIEQIEDCFILEYNPYNADTDFTLILDPLYDHDADFTNLVEQGEVACRDYPHSRHDCAIYPFKSTPHYICCKMCYCYVCDAPAPCEQWTKQSCFFKHCKATPEIQIWRDLRNAKKRKIDTYFDEFFSQLEFCNDVDHVEISHMNQIVQSLEVKKGI